MASQTMTLTVPDADVADFVDAYCERFGWTAELGVTKNAFIRTCIRQMVAEPLKTYRQTKRATTAIEAAPAAKAEALTVA